jgi:hypothetical protein
MARRVDNYDFFYIHRMRVAFSQLKPLTERGWVAGSPAFPLQVHRLGAVLHK